MRKCVGLADRLRLPRPLLIPWVVRKQILRRIRKAYRYSAVRDTATVVACRARRMCYRTRPRRSFGKPT